MNAKTRRGDDGFTLIELVITIVIMSAITFPLANFVIEYFINEAQTNYRLSDSHDVQITNAYFSQDVSNSGIRDTSASNAAQTSIWTTSPGGSYCGSGITGTTLVVLMKWDVGTDVGAAAQPQNAVAYLKTAATATAPSSLIRVYCPSTGGQTQATMAHNLAAAGASATCYAAVPPGSPVVGCGTTTRYVQLLLNVQSGTGDQQGATVTLVGQRRQT